MNVSGPASLGTPQEGERMGQIILAIFVILVGAVIRAVGPATGKPNAAASSQTVTAGAYRSR